MRCFAKIMGNVIEIMAIVRHNQARQHVCSTALAVQSYNLFKPPIQFAVESSVN